MVQLPNFGKLRSESKEHFTAMLEAPETVKTEIEDPLDEMYGPVDKRLKMVEGAEQLESKLVMPPRAVYDPLDEPSPLGLRLKKSPSFLDMIQMRLYEENSVSTSSAASTGLEIGKKKELKSTAVSGSLDKMKASNFPASILRIGNWEYVSRYEGDLVAKCYYAKHKLVWEVLDGGLKNKIEIQWSDITALKATCPDNGPATLDIVLARRPLFFRETNPQPRKHTLWQATSDFTGGEASIHKRHFLQCHQGLLNRHFEKLLQCDPRLKALNQQPEIVLESSCFEPSCLEDQDESKGLGFENMKDNHGSSAGFLDSKLPRPKTESRDKVDPVLDLSARQMHFDDSGASAKGAQPIEENVYQQTSKPPVQWEQPKEPKLRTSMSKHDLVSHLEQRISEQMASGNPPFSADRLPNKAKLEELAEHLLTDSQTCVTDEKSLMSKVNSFCSLLQKDSSFQNLLSTTEEHQYFPEDDSKQSSEKKAIDDSQPCGLTRKESFGELLMNLPRIASFPQFLFCIAEDNDD
ncbi:uncharacterized protein LOC110030931 isoform X2 [Phalaenopsis equestris]|uniref:uncharacterized protein LOC110030931 isoform X2 n=1 Tax=Phalaenopsis equestris TaxID=78828 RepID=UPI0009E3C171|nr:uncharacterized protein LOC110030931 isoform X2 [Phalaenopsis equestris]